MTHSLNYHDCAAKQRERDVISAQMAEYVAKGGKLNVVKGYEPKIHYSAYNAAKPARDAQNSQIVDANQKRILKQIAQGLSDIQLIAAALKLSNHCIRTNLIRLQKMGKVTSEKSGRNYVWALAEVEA